MDLKEVLLYVLLLKCRDVEFCSFKISGGAIWSSLLGLNQVVLATCEVGRQDLSMGRKKHKGLPKTPLNWIISIYTHWKLTWHWEIPMFNRKYTSSFMVDCPASHVSFLGGTSELNCKIYIDLLWIQYSLREWARTDGAQHFSAETATSLCEDSPQWIFSGVRSDEGIYNSQKNEQMIKRLFFFLEVQVDYFFEWSFQRLFFWGE